MLRFLLIFFTSLLLINDPLYSQVPDSSEVGYLNFKSNRDFYLQIENEGLFKSENFEQTIPLSPGYYNISFLASCRSSRLYQLQILAGSDYNYIYYLSEQNNKRSYYSESCISNSQKYFHYLSGYNYAIKTEQNTDIYIDGNLESDNFFSLQPGEHHIKLQQDNRSIEKTLTIDHSNAEKLNIDRLYIRPARFQYIAASLIPGVAQLYNRRYKTGKIQLAAFAAFTTISSAYFLRIEMLKSDYEEAFTKLDKNLLSDDYQQYYDDLVKIDTKLQRNRTFKNIAITSSILVFSYNMLDAFFINRPKFRTKNTRLKNIRLSLEGNSSELSLNAKVKL